MPIYEYQCECGYKDGHFMSMAERKDWIKCPECGKRAKFVFSNVTPVAHYPLGHARVGRGRRDRRKQSD